MWTTLARAERAGSSRPPARFGRGSGWWLCGPDLTQRPSTAFEKRTGSAAASGAGRFWDEVYASASLLDAGLAPVLRERLLAGLARTGWRVLLYVRPAAPRPLLDSPQPNPGRMGHALLYWGRVAILCAGPVRRRLHGMSRQLFATHRALHSAWRRWREAIWTPGWSPGRRRDAQLPGASTVYPAAGGELGIPAPAAELKDARSG
jgi:hypothetical protein